MPRLYQKHIPPHLFYASYFQTYVERDARQLVQITSQKSFETFVRLLAGRVGSVLNLHSLAGDVGVSSTTLAHWLSVLEASHIVFRLPCYFKNFSRRLIKSPKIYFTEVGLATWLLGIDSPAQVARDPLLGGLFENLVVMEHLKARFNAGKESNLYYFRDQQGFEVDLLLADGRTLQPIEVKASQTYDASLATNLRKFMDIAKEAQNPTVVYAAEKTCTVNGVRFQRFL
jgi:predicted AAA+ superfamily ATPase